MLHQLYRCRSKNSRFAPVVKRWKSYSRGLRGILRSNCRRDGWIMKCHPTNGCRCSARFLPHPCCRHFHTLCGWIEVEEGNTWQWLTVTHPLRPSRRSPLLLRAHPAPPLNSARLRRWILNLNTERRTYKSSSCMQIFSPFAFECSALISFPIFLPSWCLVLIFLSPSSKCLGLLQNKSCPFLFPCGDCMHLNAF